jgi:phosphoglycerate kinase
LAVPTLDSLLAARGGLRGKRVFLRADLNTPLENGRVADDTRIRASLPSLRRLLAGGARVVLASHLGRPKGERRPELSLRPVAIRLAELLGRGVGFSEQSVGEKAERAAAELEDGQLLLLENLRFHPGETKNDRDFARALAALAEVYVNDAFGTAHRAHASTVGVAELLPRRAAGELLRAEIQHLGAVREPERPLLCLLGGAKVSDKLAVLQALAGHADVLAIGGAMAYTFLLARGEATGRSLVEPDRVDDARRVLEAAAANGRRLLLPVDHVVAKDMKATEVEVRESIPDDCVALDIGPKTAEIFAAEAAGARTIFWNGPMGVCEIPSCAFGTERVARAVAESNATSIVGGGDSLAALNRLGMAKGISHLSTGGGASLEFVQGLTLPGIAALEA